MAYPQTRSMNTDLHAGMVDGKYKHMRPNRGGFPEGTTDSNQSDLSDIWYGKHEPSEVELPDGRSMAMPYHVANAPARACEEGV
jgi:hypothetical protein